jgi:aspartate beta-hydroxylase
MHGDTHIAAHRGPTNLRLRCHLGIVVPEGDCGIRVGDELGRWEQGRCIVFDDRYDHEAWNHTAAERIVLIVDLWHPGISADEVRWLESMHAYAAFHAVRLSRYWARNDAAARLAAGGPG